MLNTYIYHLLPPTFFGVGYTIFRETIALQHCKLIKTGYIVHFTATLKKKHIIFEQVMQWSH